jgi:hypothetical protein
MKNMKEKNSSEISSRGGKFEEDLNLNLWGRKTVGGDSRRFIDFGRS